MAHTNQTAHYHLPQFVGSDILNPLTDLNGAFEDIDTALYEQGQGVAGVVDDIDALKIQNGDSALDTTAQTLSGAINELKSGEDALGLRVTDAETNVSTLQTQMSTATGNITTLNTSVAGLQTEVASKASATALNNLTVKVGTGNLDTVAQNCVDAINEVNSKIPAGGAVPADEVTYDNTDSGLTATNVQDAIDEVKADIPVVPASYDANDIVYDNTTSGLTATNVQNAIDEITTSPIVKATSSGATFGDHIASLTSAWNALTSREKYKAFIEYNTGGIAALNNVTAGTFSIVDIESGTLKVTSSLIDLVNGKYYYVAGGTTYSDLTSSAVPAGFSMKLSV